MSAARVEWLRARAEKTRYDEEVNILHAEFRCVIKAFKQMSIVWCSAADQDISPGARAYAKQKGAMYSRMRDEAADQFHRARRDDDENRVDYSLVSSISQRHRE